MKSTKVILSANDTYDDISCTVTITADNTSKTITIRQGQGQGLIVTKEIYDLSDDAQTIKIEVISNIDFDIEISDDLITQAKTRGLITTKLNFNIAKNTSYDNRNGTIIINQKNGTLSSTIKVYQSQEDAKILSSKTESISNESQALEVELKKNVDFEVNIPEAAKSWVQYGAHRMLTLVTSYAFD